jgi:hypothetical protein
MRIAELTPLLNRFNNSEIRILFFCTSHLPDVDKGDGPSGHLGQNPIPLLNAFILNQDAADRASKGFIGFGLSMGDHQNGFSLSFSRGNLLLSFDLSLE